MVYLGLEKAKLHLFFNQEFNFTTKINKMFTFATQESAKFK
jgi:hypothetical protein